MSAQAVRTWLRSLTRRLNSITAQASRAAMRMAGSRMDVVTRGGPFREDADDTASRPACFRPRALRGRRLASEKLAAEAAPTRRSEEHTSELQSLMRISYDVFCLKKKKNTDTKHKG